ncbi:MAG: YfhO family protein [Bacteroidota bacterium]
MKIDLKQLIPHVTALAIFLVIVIAYFKPVFFENKQIRQGDITNHIGMSKEIVDYREKTGEEVLWTNSMFGGMPAFQISVLYKGNLLQHVYKALTLGLPHPVNIVFLYMLCFYILMLALKINPWVGIIGSLAFGLSSYFFIIIEAGHNSKGQAIAFMPAVMGSVIMAYRGKFLLGAALTALFLGLEIYCNHLQITYYLFMLLFIYFVAELIVSVMNKQLKQFTKATLYLAVGALLAVGANAGNLWSTYEYGKYTTRGTSDLTINEEGKSNQANKTSGLDRDYATAWSYGKGETMTLMIPDFKGGASEPIGMNHEDALKVVSNPDMRNYIGENASGYFGEQPFTSGPVYVGAITVFLFVLGLFLVKGHLKWVLLAGTLLSILLSWGHNYQGFTDFFLDHVPGYNKFRAVSMILVLAELTIPLLAVLVLDALIKNPGIFKEKFMNTSLTNAKVMFIAFALTGGIAALVYLSPSSFNDYFSDEEYTGFTQQMNESPKDAEQIKAFMDSMEAVRMAIVKADAGRTFLFIALALGLLWAFSRKMIGKAVLTTSLLILVGFDMLAVNWRYLNYKDEKGGRENNYEKKRAKNASPFAKFGRPGVADNAILEDKDPNFRVFNLTKALDQDAGTSYFHKSLGGYHGAKLKRYQELIDFHLGRSYYMLKQYFQKGSPDSIADMLMAKQSIPAMLNARYVIYDLNAPPYKNPYAMGNAWFVRDYKLVANADSEIVTLGKINPTITAVVDKKHETKLQGFKFTADPSASIKLTSYKPNHLIYQSRAGSEQLAVFSEIYYPSGWNVYVDGKPSEYFGVNYVLRAMRVPAGDHTIEFKFEPKTYYAGEKISLACSALLVLSLIGIGYMEFKRKQAA